MEATSSRVHSSSKYLDYRGMLTTKPNNKFCNSSCKDYIVKYCSSGTGFIDSYSMSLVSITKWLAYRCHIFKYFANITLKAVTKTSHKGIVQ